MKIVVTGAHFTSAQAVIAKLLELPDTKIVYFGRKHARDDDKALSVESKILPKFNVKFIPIVAGRLNRFLAIQTIISLFIIPIGFVQAFYYLLKVQPELIVSFGGFTGLPVVIAGWLLSIPVIVHEQGLKLGLANYISAFFANKIAVSFEDFKMPGLIDSKKVVVTGNPIRQEILGNGIIPDKNIKTFIQRAKKNNKSLVLITAGNQGSHKINLTVEDKLSDLTRIAAVIHQTGQSKFDDYSNLKKNESLNYMVEKWIDVNNLSYILNQVDLVICRAGINTLIELSVKSVPALIIPLPIGSEQTGNAGFFKKLGLGEVISDDKLTPAVFFEMFKGLLSRKKALKNSASEAKKVVILGAEKRLVQEVLLLKNQQDKLNFLK